MTQALAAAERDKLMISDQIIESYAGLERDEVLRIIKFEIATSLAANKLPRDFALVQERLAELMACEDDFTRKAINFTYWIQIDSRRLLAPQTPATKKASEIIPHLPYPTWDVHVIPETSMVLFYPLLNGNQPKGYKMNKLTAIKLAHQLEENLFLTTAYLIHDQRPCPVMWLQEDGVVSIQSDLRFHYVNQLERVLAWKR